MPINGNWDENRKYVLSSIEALEDRMERDFANRMENDQRLATELNATLRAMTAEIASLKTKAGVWGLIAGGIPAALTILYLIIDKRL